MGFDITYIHVYVGLKLFFFQRSSRSQVFLQVSLNICKGEIELILLMGQYVSVKITLHLLFITYHYMSERERKNECFCVRLMLFIYCQF